MIKCHGTDWPAGQYIFIYRSFELRDRLVLSDDIVRKFARAISGSESNLELSGQESLKSLASQI